MTVKRYAERDAMELDKAGDYYCRHVMAMTSEGLHNKGDIAAELGFRDMQIDALQAQVNALAAQRKALIQEMEMAANDIAYAVYNLADMKMSDLKPGIIESTGPAETALIAERNLRQFAAQLRNGEQGGE